MPANAVNRGTKSKSNKLPSHENPNDEMESFIVPDMEKIEDIPAYVNQMQETETTINNESEWQKPISLKALKKKLNETFVIKYGRSIQILKT